MTSKKTTPPEPSSQRAKARTPEQKAAALTPNQEKYARLIATGKFNCTECAKKAGYGGKNISQMVTRLNKNEGIKFRIEQIRNETGEAHGVNLDDITYHLKRSRDQAYEQGKTGDAIKATMELAKIYGIGQHNQKDSKGAVNIFGNYTPQNDQEQSEQTTRFQKVLAAAGSPPDPDIEDTEPAGEA